MLRKPLILALAVLALATVACNITINIPVEEFQAGPTQIDEILILEPDADVADVSLTFGAGELEIRPGAEEGLIEGEASYNVMDFKPEIKVSGDRVRLQTGSMENGHIPKFGENLENAWNLELSDMPMNLTINAGAYQGDLDLGGLSLMNLEIADGAADVRVKFSEPNLVEMETLQYMTGASNVRLTGLANANFTSMVFRSGAGDYTLDFSGELTRDAVVHIESGISRVVISVPEDMNVKLDFKGGLASVEVDDEWSRSGEDYVINGDGPLLIIHVDLGAGSLELKTD